MILVLILKWIPQIHHFCDFIFEDHWIINSCAEWVLKAKFFGLAHYPPKQWNLPPSTNFVWVWCFVHIKHKCLCPIKYVTSTNYVLTVVLPWNLSVWMLKNNSHTWLRSQIVLYHIKWPGKWGIYNWSQGAHDTQGCYCIYIYTQASDDEIDSAPDPDIKVRINNCYMYKYVCMGVCVYVCMCVYGSICVLACLWNWKLFQLITC